MSGEALFWVFIVVFSVLMLVGFFLVDRPRKGKGVSPRLGVYTHVDDPRGRHAPAERVDPHETDDRL